MFLLYFLTMFCFVYLQAFLEKEYSQENIDFWSKCEQYKKISDQEKVNKVPNVEIQ